MKLGSSIALAGLAAAATCLVIRSASAGLLAPDVPALAESSVFVPQARVLELASGECQAVLDVGEGLLAGSGSDDPFLQVAGEDARIESPAAGAVDEAGFDAPFEAAAESASADAGMPLEVAALDGGTCGPLFAAQDDPEALAAAEEVDATAVADVRPPESPPGRNEVVASPEETRVAVASAPARAVKPAAAPAARVQPKPPAPVFSATAWWPDRRPDALNILFVGEASFASAISILTDGRFDDGSEVDRYIDVRDRHGRRVPHRWRVATNPRMLLLPVDPGVYTVTIQAQLADVLGRQAGIAADGTVRVR